MWKLLRDAGAPSSSLAVPRREDERPSEPVDISRVLSPDLAPLRVRECNRPGSRMIRSVSEARARQPRSPMPPRPSASACTSRASIMPGGAGAPARRGADVNRQTDPGRAGTPPFAEPPLFVEHARDKPAFFTSTPSGRPASRTRAGALCGAGRVVIVVALRSPDRRQIQNSEF